jgi:hypothetical protein
MKDGHMVQKLKDRANSIMITLAHIVSIRNTAG